MSLKSIEKPNRQKLQIGDGTKSFVKNLFSRDLGLISSKSFIQNSNSIIFITVKQL